MAEPTPRDMLTHSGDPQALEVLQIKAWATQLADIASTWLEQREAYRRQREQRASARQHRAHTDILTEVRSRTR